MPYAAMPYAAMRTLQEITSDAELIDEGEIQPLYRFDPEAVDEDPVEDQPA